MRIEEVIVRLLSYVGFWLLAFVPAMLTVSPAMAGQLRLSWVDSSGDETGFVVERKVGTGSYTQLQVIGSNAASYTDQNLTVGTLYCYRVRAFNGHGSSAPSNEACGIPGTFKDVSGSYWA